MREDAQTIPQSRSSALPRHQKERWRTNKDNTNAIYETTDAQTKKNCNRLETVSRKQNYWGIHVCVCVCVGGGGGGEGWAAGEWA